MQWGIHVNKLFRICCIKIHCLNSSLILYGSFTQEWFYIMHWSFDKCCFPELCRSSKWWHISLYNIFKNHISNITADLIRERYDIGKLSSYGGRYYCPKILIFTWNLKFYCWQQMLSTIFLKVMDFIFEKMAAKYPSLKNIITCSLK